MIKTIIWDFDGVILDSMCVRDWGFEEIFKGYQDKDLEELMEFHSRNGGLSRYVKIRYFFEEILSIKVTDEKVLELANKFSLLMKKELINKKYLILESLNFIEENYNAFNFHIASGSDQKELRFLCEKLNISKYFESIHGSPEAKNDLVRTILETNNLDKATTCLIGDSVNDYQAAKINNILFLAYNNTSLNRYNDIKPLY